MRLALSDDQCRQLLDYAELLQRWSAVHNLTAFRDPRQILVQHLLDSLAILPALRRHARGEALRVLDVGSGGGLPGVVLAIAEPGWQVICLDAVAKKAAFVRQVAGSLSLANLASVHARVEAWKPERRFDVVVSRAFAALSDFTGLTAHLLDDRTVWLAMKGRMPAEELAALPATVSVFHVEPLDVPGLEAQRCLIWMRRH